MKTIDTLLQRNQGTSTLASAINCRLQSESLGACNWFILLGGTSLLCKTCTGLVVPSSRPELCACASQQAAQGDIQFSRARKSENDWGSPWRCREPTQGIQDS